MLRRRSITVFFMAHSRRNYLEHTVRQLAACETATLKLVSVVFLVTSKKDVRALLRSLLRLWISGVPARIVIAGKYSSKAEEISRATTDFIMKCDEDIFMTSATWTAFVTRALEADWTNVRVISPIISSGIPSYELFLSHYGSPSFKAEMAHILAKVEIPGDLWGADYSGLGGIYRNRGAEEFFRVVKRLHHPYKGIHPLRLSEEGQRRLLRFCMEDQRWSRPDPNFGWVEIAASPYFCNSAFISTSSFYRGVVEGMASGRYFDDGFDEVALNQALDNDGRRILFDTACVAIHPSYNSIGSVYRDLSDEFFRFVSGGGLLQLSGHKAQAGVID